MPTINFPSGPSLNDTYNLGVRTWKWNGEAWALQPLTGGFTGSQGYTGSTGIVAPLTIDTTNNRVGINQTSPATTLEVRAAIPKIRINDTDGSDLITDLCGAAADFQIKLDPNNAGTAGSFRVFISGEQKFNIRPTGRIGIGTNAPEGMMEIVNNTISDDSLLLTSTEDSSSAGPVITLKRNSSSPDDGDYLGQIKFKGENDADQEIIYAKITAKISDASDGTEDGILEFTHKKAGSNAITGRWKSDKLMLINGTSLEVDGTLTVGGTAITPATVPTISSISPTAVVTSTSTAVTITGTNFTSIPQVEALNTSTGIWYPADSIAFTNSTTIVATFTLSVNASYKLRIENPDGNAVLSSSALLSVSAAPTFSTSAGSLGSFAGGFSGTIATLAGSSDSAISFSETTNVLTNASQANCSLNSSTGAITTTNLGGSSTTATTYNFTVRITDAESQTVDRSFSITTSYGATGGAQFN